MSLITGASVWEQDIYDYVCDHVVTEGALLEEYQQLAEDQSGSPAFRYLANLILADERRHHQLFNDLAESIRQMAEMRLEEEPIPSLHGLRADRERISSATERLLAAERADASNSSSSPRCSRTCATPLCGDSRWSSCKTTRVSTSRFSLSSARGRREASPDVRRARRGPGMSWTYVAPGGAQALPRSMPRAGAGT